MRSFGQAGGGGRRIAARCQTPMLALLMTMTASRSAVVVDVSNTGVRLSGRDLPTEGDFMEMKIDRYATFGTVIWRCGMECGVSIDPELTDAQVSELRAKASKAAQSNLSVEERVALDEWTHGISR